MTGTHDDAAADAIALVEAAVREDVLGCGAVLRNMEPGAVAVSLAKLLAELVAENGRGYGAGPCCFRRWAEEAIKRSS